MPVAMQAGSGLWLGSLFASPQPPTVPPAMRFLDLVSLHSSIPEAGSCVLSPSSSGYGSNRHYVSSTATIFRCR